MYRNNISKLVRLANLIFLGLHQKNCKLALKYGFTTPFIFKLKETLYTIEENLLT